MSDFPVDLHSTQSISVGSTPESVVATSFAGFTPASGAVTANQAYYYPLKIDRAVRVRKLWVLNGTAVSGNIDMAVYDYALRRLVSAGSTAQAGISTCQIMDVTDTDLGPGLYYLAFACDNTTARIMQSAGPDLGIARILGMAQQASAFPLPNPMVPAAMATGITLMVGMVTGRVV